jgi:hypothetical protein
MLQIGLKSLFTKMPGILPEETRALSLVCEQRQIQQKSPGTGKIFSDSHLFEP